MKKTNKNFNKLVNEVIKTVGEENIPQLAQEGAEVGFPGITYYKDTYEFSLKNRREIKKLLDEVAEEAGMSSIDLLRSLKGYEQYMEEDLVRFLAGKKPKGFELTNLICWLTCETIAKKISNTN